MAADTLHTPRLHTGPAPGTPGISLHGLTLAYGRRVLLRDADAVLPQGSITALIGRNGTGKSTLLRAIAGLGTATGEIRLCGKPLAALTALQRASTVSFVTTDKIRIANLACEDVVALGRAPYTNWIGRMQQADRDIVSRSLSLVGMSSFARKTMDRMSDGECQRILIARALAQDTPVILLDEPTAFLDLPNRRTGVAAAPPGTRRGQMHLLLDARPRRGARALRRHSAHRHPHTALHVGGRHGGERPYRTAFRRRRHLVRPCDADHPARKKVEYPIFFRQFFVKLTFLFTFAPLKPPFRGYAIVVLAHSSIG